jgi:hypothetical protein
MRDTPGKREGAAMFLHRPRKGQNTPPGVVMTIRGALQGRDVAKEGNRGQENKVRWRVMVKAVVCY